MIEPTEPFWAAGEGPSPIAPNTYALVPADFDRFINLHVDVAGRTQSTMLIATCDTPELMFEGTPGVIPCARDAGLITCTLTDDDFSPWPG
ncbi:MAG TPA: hypothetical protein VF103_14565 [Polyangiaceae bacterium]